MGGDLKNASQSDVYSWRNLIPWQTIDLDGGHEENILARGTRSTDTFLLRGRGMSHLVSHLGSYLGSSNVSVLSKSNLRVSLYFLWGNSAR